MAVQSNGGDKDRGRGRGASPAATPALGTVPNASTDAKAKAEAEAEAMEGAEAEAEASTGVDIGDDDHAAPPTTVDGPTAPMATGDGEGCDADGPASASASAAALALSLVGEGRRSGAATIGTTEAASGGEASEGQSPNTDDACTAGGDEDGPPPAPAAGGKTAVGALRRRWLSRRRRRRDGVDDEEGATGAAVNATPTATRGRVAAVSDSPVATTKQVGGSRRRRPPEDERVPPSRKRARPAGSVARDDRPGPGPAAPSGGDATTNTTAMTTGTTVGEIPRQTQMERLRAVEARLLRERLRVESERRANLETELSRLRRELTTETRRRRKLESELATARSELAGFEGDVTWGDNLGRLLLYKAEHGDCAVPNRHDGGRVGGLSHWVRTLRRWKRGREASAAKAGAGGAGDGDADGDDVEKDEESGAKAKATATATAERFLTDERIKVLDSIGFVWRVGGQGTAADRAKFWEKNFDELVQFKERNGHCNATQKTRLGGWVKSQRERYKETQRRLEYVERKGTDVGFKSKFQHSCMTKDQIDRLNGLGFEWTLMPAPLGWDAQFEELVEYKKEHGHTRVPQSYHGRRRLGRWVSRQRELYWDRTRTKKKYCYAITDERIAKLEGIGFLWRPSGEKKDGQDAEEKKDGQEDAVRAAVPTLPPYCEELL